MPNGVLYSGRPARRLAGLIAERFDLIDPDGQTSPDKLTAEQRAEVVAWVKGGSTRIDGAVMDRFPNLKLIACYGSGYDGVDVAAAHARGITVCNSIGANAAPVADLAIALMLAVMRDVARLDAFVKAGKWPTPERAKVGSNYGMTGAKVGIYGIGHIGEKIAARAAAFEAEVGYFSRSKRDHLPYGYHASLESLADWCDVLHVAVRAGDDTRHVINADILRRLGPDGFLINISRGSVVDEAALLEALRNKTIAGAGLDVMQNEPNVNPAFFGLPNIVINPHQAGHTFQGHAAMQDRVMENLSAFFAGRPVPYVVKPD